MKEKILNEIRRIAKEQRLQQVSKQLFKRFSSISEHQIYQNFSSWNEAVELAGLQPITTSARKTDNELFEELLRLAKEVGAVPSTIQMSRLGKFDLKVYRKRWGGWDNVLMNFRAWLVQNYPDSQFINLIKSISGRGVPVVKVSQNNNEFVWEGKKGVIYGPPMDFRGLRHEPVNEQGVVFLFGKISEEIGFSIEAIRTNFPDCDGKRLVDKTKNHWERVSIEFEYYSRNFLEHGHKLDGCDVIVCWIHNWEDCPIEVIELREVIKRLKK